MTGLARSRLDSGDADVLANIAEDYYVNGQNQDVIATRYNISRSYVSRLLGRARELGIVVISVRREIRRDTVLESMLRERYGLLHCAVVADVAIDPEVVLRRAGQLAATILADSLRPESSLGLAWGNGVRAVIEAMPPGRARATRVVQMFGGLSTAPAEIMSGELLVQAARALDATADRLHAPWIVETAELARALLDQPDIAAVLQRAATADVALVGIGATGRGSSGALFNRTYLNAAELAEIDEQGAVGDICGRLFDVDGRPCALSAMERVIGLELDAIRRLPLVIGIATGREKHRAIRAALQGGLVSALVTDSEAAREVLGDGHA
jgi:DNA-binding transcriptional regulator LsrR (DeoR family)